MHSPNTIQLLRPHLRRQRYRRTTALPPENRLRRLHRIRTERRIHSARERLHSAGTKAACQGGHVVISAVGAKPTQLVFGDWPTGPAWSTSKVPLTIAALREEHQPTVTDEMRAAITKSDNAAAERIWENLGDPVTAAHKIEAVLREYGDPTTVEWRRELGPSSLPSGRPFGR